MPLHGYKVRKAAQVAAFFALRSGGTINVLKLAKLLYLADRECLAEYDFPILFDRFVSMDYGPVTSRTLNYVNGYEEDRANWDTFITDRERYSIGLARSDLSEADLDELSDAEFGILERVWDRYGWMNQYQLSDYTHRHCPEWEDPHGSSAPIPYERVLKFLGKEHAADIVAEIDSIRALDKALAPAR